MLIKSKYRKQLLSIFLSLLVIGGGLLYQQFQKPKTAQASFGELDVDFGVPEGDPIFTVSDFKPGDCEERTVQVTNSGQGDIEVAVRTDNEIDDDSLSTQLTIVISENGTYLYGSPGDKKMLNEFFQESDDPDGVPLSTLSSGGETDYTFKVCFDIEAGNEYQETSVVFDLIFGEQTVPVELPAVCDDLEGIVTEEIVGTNGDDKIKATGASEYIRGRGGNDEIHAGGGDDCIIGGNGNDVIRGGTGNDIIVGNSGNDFLDGGSGTDLIRGGAGNDEIKGGSDNDVIYGQAGNDEIDGDSGKDKVYGGNGNDTIHGGSGDDELYGQKADDVITGGSGDDLLHGGPGYDDLDGNSGMDVCISGDVLNSCEL